MVIGELSSLINMRPLGHCDLRPGGTTVDCASPDVKLIDVPVLLDSRLPNYPNNAAFSLEKTKRISRGDSSNVSRVLIKTCNSRLWSSPEFHTDYVGLTESDARHPVEPAVKVVGVDYISVEQFRTPDAPAHHVLPLRIIGADGAPVRVVLRRS